MPRPPLPDEGSPAYTAAADQQRKAQDDTNALVLDLIDAGALVVDGRGPWARKLLDSTDPSAARRLTCVHVGRTPFASRPLLVLRERLVMCETCYRVAAEPAGARCAVCGSEGPDLRVCVSQRNVRIATARLCPTCVYAERVHRLTGA
jgi:hypothetical protein